MGKTERRLFIFVFILLNAVYAMVGFAETGSGDQAKQQPTAAASIDPILMTFLREQAQRAASAEVNAKMLDAEKGMLKEASQTEKRTEDLIFYITLAAAGWGVVATLIVGAGAVTGIAGYRAVERIREAETNVVEPVKNRMNELEQNISAALKNAVQYVQTKTDRNKLPSIVGSRAEPPIEEVQQMEEADIIIVIADKIGGSAKPDVISEKELTIAFIQLGRYWNHIENYPRAMARSQRAIALDRNAWEAYQGMTRAFHGMATSNGTPSWVRDRQLNTAEQYCKKAELAADKPNATILFDYGFIENSRGNFAAAIERYCAAKNANPGIELAVIKYNLAVCYAKVAEFADAFSELRGIVGVEENWECIPNDPDFKWIFADSLLGPQIRALIDTERSAHTRGA